MIPKELREIIADKKSKTVSEIQNIIFELKKDIITEQSKLSAEKKWEQGYYSGESNAFYICLDLLDKLKEEEQ